MVCGDLQRGRRFTVAALDAETYSVTAIETMIRETLATAAQPRAAEGGVRVPTTTLLPGGDVLSILVMPDGAGWFRVSDGGAAREAILDGGVLNLRPADRRRATEIANATGLELDGDAFVVRSDAGQLTAAIAYVADASRSWATYVLERISKAQERTLAEKVQGRLERIFLPARVAREASVLGGSNSQHVFDFVVTLDDERRALFEIVSPHVQSIAAAHLKFSDVREAHGEWPREAVIETPQGWSAENIALLSQAASHVRPATVEWADLQSLAA